MNYYMDLDMCFHCSILVLALHYPVKIWYHLLAKLQKEIELGRILGPLKKSPISNLHCSPVGVVPKKQGGWRMIMNLSSPAGRSVNDFIDPQECTVKYFSFDEAGLMIQIWGPLL